MFITIFSFSQTRDLIGKWKLESVKNISGNKIDSTFLNSGYLSIKFLDNKNYTISLSENTCTGTYSAENGLKINAASCTKICCDDNKSMDFYHMLLDADKYKMKNGNLLIYSKMKELTLVKQ